MEENDVIVKRNLASKGEKLKIKRGNPLGFTYHVRKLNGT